MQVSFFLCTFAPQNRTAATDCMKKCVFHIGFLVILMLCSSCVSRGVREAQEVVAQADSLWHDGQMYGIDMGDSATLAQAYETLDKSTAFCRRIRDIFPFVLRTSSLGTYSHACYHYGRLLREKDDPVAAMQAFINATHSHTDDLHTLGRVYSNMATMCRQAGHHELAINLFEHSADCFMQNNDTVSYYYALNNIAFDNAELGDRHKTDSIISEIEQSCSDTTVLLKITETKAEAFLNSKQYDSAIYYATEFYEKSSSITGIVIKAQAFSYMGKKDSSLCYAAEVMNRSKYSGDLYNALYILSHDDSTLCNEDILELTSTREDVRMLNYEPWKEKRVVAAKLAEIDRERKPDWKWKFFLLVILLIATVSAIIIYVHNKKQKRKTTILSQKVELITKRFESIQSNKTSYVEQQCQVFCASHNIHNDLCWKDYDHMCDIVDQHFYQIATKLRQKQILNEQEIRLCILVLLNFKRNQIAEMLLYAQNGVGKLKYRVAQKLGTEGKNLRNYLISVATDEAI